MLTLKKPFWHEAEDLCEFKASLVYIMISRISRATQKDPVSKKKKKKNYTSLIPLLKREAGGSL